MSLVGFNAMQVDPMKGYEPLPANQYKMVFISCEEKENNAKTGSYQELIAQVIDGEFSNRTVIVRLNLNNPNQTAVQIAQSELSAICHAIGVKIINAKEDLLNKPFLAKVKVTPARGEYGPGNEIKGYEPVPQAAATPQSGFSQPAWKK